MSPYRILRDDGRCDAIAGRSYASYDEAHVVLERYYADLCCSDEREYYRIEEEPQPAGGQTGGNGQSEGSGQTGGSRQVGGTIESA
jgi:hypothetical protein